MTRETVDVDDLNDLLQQALRRGLETYSGEAATRLATLMRDADREVASMATVAVLERSSGGRLSNEELQTLRGLILKATLKD